MDTLQQADAATHVDREAGTPRAAQGAMIIHLVARLAWGSPPLREGAAALWRSLRRAFPEAYAATLMPDHLHLITGADDPAAARRTLACILGRHRARFGPGGRRSGPGAWTVPPPRVVPDRKHLRRQIRYVSLNPCRSALARDPLAWLWSTHRDVVGAVADPWVTSDRLAAALGERAEGFAARHHRYVSSDPTTRVDGTAMPRVVPTVDGSLDALEEAACAAARWTDPADARGRKRARRLFHALARAVRIRWRVALTVTGARYSTAQTWARTTTEAELRAALLCLADVRLRAPRDVRRFPSLRSPPASTKRLGFTPTCGPSRRNRDVLST